MKKYLLTILLIIIGTTSLSIKAESLISTENRNDITYRKELNGVIQNRSPGIARLKSNGKIVYCIEPMKSVKVESSYKELSMEEASRKFNIDKDILDYINLIAFYGYGYKDRNDSKWYAITQLLIWRKLEPKGNFYFTESLKGNKSNRFDKELIELENDVKKHLQRLLLDKNNYQGTINKEIIIYSNAANFEDYEIQHEGLDVKTEGTKLIIKGDKEGDYKIKFQKKTKNLDYVPIIYYDHISQNLIVFGKYKDIDEEIKVELKAGKIIINKEDSKLGLKNAGSAHFIGTKFRLTDENGNVYEKEIVDDNQVIFDNLMLGKYLIEEIKAGTGYKLNKDIVREELLFDNNEKKITIKNQVIEKEIELTKYKKDLALSTEADINFKISGIDNDLNKEIKTDIDGKAKFKLPYGKYQVKQLNTTSGYSYVKDFEINVDNEESENIELVNLKLPNAATFDFRYFILLSLIGLYVKNIKKPLIN